MLSPIIFKCEILVDTSGFWSLVYILYIWRVLNRIVLDIVQILRVISDSITVAFTLEDILRWSDICVVLEQHPLEDALSKRS
jgi:hypothetical protein